MTDPRFVTPDPSTSPSSADDATARTVSGNGNPPAEGGGAALVETGAPATEATAPAAERADVAAQLTAARREIAELKDAWLRARAESENIRRQAAIDRDKGRKYAIESFAESLLPVRDSLEATLANPSAAPETLLSGVELTLRQLVSAFERAQLTSIEPVGEKFDPHRHQAINLVDSEQPANTVVQVLQKGYLLGDRVLRPALVTVAKGSDAA